jgi:hypothetical protein
MPRAGDPFTIYDSEGGAISVTPEAPDKAA